jgi:site-specific recombinase XerD
LYVGARVFARARLLSRLANLYDDLDLSRLNAARVWGATLMPRFRVLQGTGLAAFVIADETGRVEPQSERFLTALGLRDLSPYTILAYARGLAHFHGWCVEHGVRLAEVTPTTVQAYIEAFRWPGEGERAAATTNHRLSVLASYFDHLIAAGSGAPEWRDKANPVRPAQRLERTVPMRRRAGRVRADLRRRLPRRVPVHLSPEEIEAVYGAATSWRDRALLRLLEWSGQRVGDWDAVHGRHGLLGLRVGDVDCVARTVTVRLKGARDDHVVPVGEAFWPDYRAYLERERGAPEHPAVWIARRKGGGRPLGYPTFETMIRVLRRRSGVSRLSAHAYRHTTISHWSRRSSATRISTPRPPTMPGYPWPGSWPPSGSSRSSSGDHGRLQAGMAEVKGRSAGALSLQTAVFKPAVLMRLVAPTMPFLRHYKPVGWLRVGLPADAPLVVAVEALPARSTGCSLTCSRRRGRPVRCSSARSFC